MGNKENNWGMDTLKPACNNGYNPLLDLVLKQKFM